MKKLEKISRLEQFDNSRLENMGQIKGGEIIYSATASVSDGATDQWAWTGSPVIMLVMDLLGGAK